MRILLDTSAYSNMNRGHERAIEIVKNADEVIISNICIAELSYGFEFGNRKEENYKVLERFLENEAVTLVLPDMDTTRYYVEIAVHCKKAGVKPSANDIWLAALSLQYDAALISFDKDFQHLDHPKLKLLYN